MSSDFRKLTGTHYQSGEVRWIGLRPGRREPMRVVDAVECSPEEGLAGDRHGGGPGSPRQVTLIQEEHLGVIASLARLRDIDPAALRRNVVVAGVNLQALRKSRFRIGTALLEGTGDCDPCSRMEEALGPGGYQAMRGHGGITASVIEGGTIRLGDAVVPAPEAREDVSVQPRD